MSLGLMGFGTWSVGLGLPHIRATILHFSPVADLGWRLLWQGEVQLAQQHLGQMHFDMRPISPCLTLGRAELEQ
jgi:hypothetical protein